MILRVDYTRVLYNLIIFLRILRNLNKTSTNFSDINIPLTFLAGDILHYLCSSDRDYFKLNEKNSKDNKEHYFYFKKSYAKENKNIIRFTYIGHQKPKILKYMISNN